MSDKKIVDLQVKRKIYKYLFVEDLAVLAVCWGVPGALSVMVHPKLKIIYIVFTIIFGFFCIYSNKSWGHKKGYHMLLVAFRFRERTYRAHDRLDFENLGEDE